MVYRIGYEGENGSNTAIIEADNKVEALKQFYSSYGELIYSYIVEASNLNYNFYNDESSVKDRLLAKLKKS